ncbi:MAG TPA: hypothetical protein VHF50_06020 [Solirubrobacterales bacterium]|nr:hypothetical protein [Solirubrobacterales bacterium]
MTTDLAAASPLRSDASHFRPRPGGRSGRIGQAEQEGRDGEASRRRSRPGQVVLHGKGLKKTAKTVKKKGKVALEAIPKEKQKKKKKKKKKKKLEEKGKLKVPAILTFIPKDGQKQVKKVSVLLRDKTASKK